MGIAARYLNALVGPAPRDHRALALWVLLHCGLHLPARGLCPGHSSPLDYLAHAFLQPETANPDCVVWACRGGGKTQLGALATLLDMLYKPGIQVRILGGSLDQSSRMYEHLRRIMFRPQFWPLLDGKMTARGFTLVNGSRVDILAQSDCAVRGQRVQKLRCDEVELFDPDVWQAAQLITRSIAPRTSPILIPPAHARILPVDPPAPPEIRAGIEAISTMHLPGGLMQKLVEQSPQLGRRVFSWCLWDVIEKCPPARDCQNCPLWDQCQGRAKNAAGFMKIDDLIAMKSRVSPVVWEREMLCLPPRFDDSVFAGFTRADHVREFSPADWTTIDGRPVEWFNGVDFGFAGAFVCLWIALERDLGASGDRRVWVWDELVARRVTLDACVQQMMQRSPTISWIQKACCDSAGSATNSHTSSSDLAVLRRHGYTAAGCTRPIETGIETIRMLLRAADGVTRLTIHPRCTRLIAALEGYRLDPATARPVKDGLHDHLIDALRYALTGSLTTGLKIRAY